MRLIQPYGGRWIVDKVDKVDVFLKVKKSHLPSSTTSNWLDRYRSAAHGPIVSTISTKLDVCAASPESTDDSAGDQPWDEPSGPSTRPTPPPLMTSPPCMAFEDEERLFDRYAEGQSPEVTAWLWARGDQYADHRRAWTFRQCQLAACVDYEEHRS